MNLRSWRLILCVLLLGAVPTLVAQGPPGRDRDNPPPGHGGMPPGQAKKHDHIPPGQAKKYGDDRGLPPGQAKKYFRDQDRDHYYRYYGEDAERWRRRGRPMFAPGEYIPSGVVIRLMPRNYWINVAPPPPPGYRYGYCGGYVVAYNPTTRMIADVLDLLDAARSR